MYNKLKKRKGAYALTLGLSLLVLVMVGFILFAQHGSSLREPITFHSEEYGFSAQYPASWSFEIADNGKDRYGKTYLQGILFKGPHVGGNKPYAGSAYVSINVHAKQSMDSYIKSLDAPEIPGPDTSTLRSFTVGSHEAVEIDVNDGDGGGHHELLVSTPRNLIVVSEHMGFVGGAEAYDLISNSLRFDQ